MVQLHADCERRLVEVVAASLSVAQFNGRGYLATPFDLFDAGDRALPKPVVQQLSPSVSETPFSTFALGHLLTLTQAGERWEGDDTRPVTSLAALSDPAAAARTFVEVFKTLPWRYCFVLETGLTLPKREGVTVEYAVNDRIRLFQPGSDIHDRYPRDSNAGKAVTLMDLLLERAVSRSPEWNAERVYCAAEVDGYAHWLTTRTSHNAQQLLRSLVGMMAGSNLVSLQTRPRGSAGREASMFCYLASPAGWTPSERQLLDSDHADCLERLRWDGFFETFSASPDNALALMAKWLGLGFTAGEPEITLQRCCQWFFDSHCGENQLLQFVQGTVALEILLGDKEASDIVGIGELIANRCAYLLGDTHARRRELIAEFKRIYDTRSHIVHRGKSFLSEDERFQLERLRWLCGCLISKELLTLNHAGQTKSANGAKRL